MAYTEALEIITLFVNKTNQVEVVYEVVGNVDGEEKFRRREGRVWSPTDDMASDTLSGAHPDVKKLALAYWTPAVIQEFSDGIVAQQTAERQRQADALAQAEQTKSEAEAAQAASEKAQADAKAAADAAEAEAKRLTDALAAQAAAEKAAEEKKAFDTAVAAKAAELVAAQPA